MEVQRDVQQRRQAELEALYRARKNTASASASSAARSTHLAAPNGRGHSPQLSISDDTHHVTETIHSWYDEPNSMEERHSNRPLSYINSPSEREGFEARRQRRHGALLGAVGGATTSPPATPTSPPSSAQGRFSPHRMQSSEGLPSAASREDIGNGNPSLQRMGSQGQRSPGQHSPTTPPPLSRQSSTDTAIQQFPLNDIDYESSPAAVAQELSNLQAIRRMSMNVDTADPDLPSFGGMGSISSVAPTDTEDEDDPSKLFWVPARLHPELAPKEFKTFIEDRVDRIRRRSGDENSLSPEGLSRSGSGDSNLRRKKSMLSHSIDTRGHYQDGAERLERKRSKGMQLEGQTTVANLHDLEELVNDPAQLMSRMSLEAQRRSLESPAEVPASEDMPILPPAMGTLKRSTRTTYRRGSLKKGERVPFSKRAAQRRPEPGADEQRPESPVSTNADEREPVLGLTRVQTEPIPPPKDPRHAHPYSRHDQGHSLSSEDLQAEPLDQSSTSPPQRNERVSSEDSSTAQLPSSQQPRKFQSRIASPGRTTAQLPGYDNKNPLPQIVETLPDGSKVPTNHLVQAIPERKSSHEVPHQFQRGGAHMRPAPGSSRQTPQSSKLDDLSANPSPLPGSGSMGTDSLTMIPTFDEKKNEKKEGGRKSSWKWILGSDDKAKDDSTGDSSKSSKSGKQGKNSTDKARLDVLQNSIDGTVPSRGRESLVLNREDVRLEEERRKDGKKPESSKKEKESGLLSAIFGNKKKTSDGDLKEKKKKGDRHHSPEPPPRILKPDIDYNWTRFSILEERAIYRMAHIKLANPRRALYSQVLLSNFMYSYLAKVQMMHPQMQIPAQRTAQQREQQQKQQQQQQQQQSQQPPEYNQYQRWQEEQARQDSANQAASETRTSFDAVHETQRDSNTTSTAKRASADEYARSGSHNPQGYARANGSPGGNNSSSAYKVADTNAYLGYQKANRSQDHHSDFWNDDEREEELW
ncbi:hypothetical protein CBER1_01310 [Cercospora berteroae]|uniref:Protein Zds1 C-terminal domain-containing protein n=1 Tax=Cercospora berteroae TaxID=357750 RepID=A0A2S6CKN5_9PEZI|nr:hypothetical protein CBER1_01310 [Cercospora berteroae]